MSPIFNTKIIPINGMVIMKTKEEIVMNWLPRYTGEALENFGQYIILTNFSNYVSLFAQWNNVKVVGEDRPVSRG